MKLIFFDTEFTDLCPDRKLISVGFVSEDGKREFYAELADNYLGSDCSEFVIESVLPQLRGGDVLMTMRELSLRLLEWTKGFGEQVQFATDSLTWDWPWIELIWADVGAHCLENTQVWPDIKNATHRLASVGRPPNVELKPLDLPQTPDFILAVEQAFENGLRQHHALDDAKANRLGWLACNCANDANT